MKLGLASDSQPVFQRPRPAVEVHVVIVSPRRWIHLECAGRVAGGKHKRRGRAVKVRTRRGPGVRQIRAKDARGGRIPAGTDENKGGTHRDHGFCHVHEREPVGIRGENTIPLDTASSREMSEQPKQQRIRIRRFQPPQPFSIHRRRRRSVGRERRGNDRYLSHPFSHQMGQTHSQIRE